MEEIKSEINSSMPSTNEILMEAITSANVVPIDNTNDIKENIFDGGGISSTNDQNDPGKMFVVEQTVSSTTPEAIAVTTVGSSCATEDQMVTITYVESSELPVSDMSQSETEMNPDSVIEHEPSMEHEIVVPLHDDNNDDAANALLNIPQESEEIVTAEKMDEPEIQIVSETVGQKKPKPKPATTNILHSYILNHQNKGVVRGNKPILIGPKQQTIAVPVSLPNQLTGATMLAIPQNKGPKKIVILPPPNSQNFSSNSIQRCIIRPQSGMQIPQLIFIPSATTSTGVNQVQNITTVPALGGAPLIMTSCLRPNITQTQVRNSGPRPQIRTALIQAPTIVTNQIRPIRTTYSNKVRAVAPTTISSNATSALCEKCKSPVSGQITKPVVSVQKKRDSQTQTPSQTFRSNNTAPLITAMQQRCKKYNQAARAFKAKIKRLEGKVDTLQKQVKSGGKPIKTIENIVKASKPHLSETAHDLFRLLLCSEPGKSSTCTRYADCTKDFALSLYCCSKTAYRVCQSVFKLPTPHGLMRKTRNIADKPSSSGATESIDNANQIEEGEVVVEGENGEDEELLDDHEDLGDDMIDDDEEEHDEDDEEEMADDDDEEGDKNEDEQAVTEVVELMHCEPEVGFDSGQFEIIIPDSQRT